MNIINYEKKEFYILINSILRNNIPMRITNIIYYYQIMSSLCYIKNIKNIITMYLSLSKYNCTISESFIFSICLTIEGLTKYIFQDMINIFNIFNKELSSNIYINKKLISHVMTYSDIKNNDDISFTFHKYLNQIEYHMKNHFYGSLPYNIKKYILGDIYLFSIYSNSDKKINHKSLEKFIKCILDVDIIINFDDYKYYCIAIKIFINDLIRMSVLLNKTHKNTNLTCRECMFSLEIILKGQLLKNIEKYIMKNMMKKYTKRRNKYISAYNAKTH